MAIAGRDDVLPITLRLLVCECYAVTKCTSRLSLVDGDFCDSYYSSPNTVMCQLTVFARFQSRPYCLWRWRSQHQWGFSYFIAIFVSGPLENGNGPDCSEPS
jgi:hypothetical protein